MTSNELTPRSGHMLVWTARARARKKTLLTMEIMRIMAMTTARMTKMVTLVITSMMATMMTQTMETSTTMVKMMLVWVILHLKLFYSAEKNDGGNETEEVDPGLSCLRGHHSTQSYGHKWSGMRNIYIIYVILWVKLADSILRSQHHAIDTNILFQQ